MTAKTKTEVMFALVDQWKTSGVTQKQFCLEHGLKAGTFAYWVAKKKRLQASAGGFALVDVRGESVVAQVDITYPNGVRISTDVWDLSLISQLIRLY